MKTPIQASTFVSLSRKIAFTLLLSSLLSLGAFGLARAHAAHTLESVHDSLGSDLLRFLGSEVEGSQSVSGEQAMIVKLNGARLRIQSASFSKSEISLDALVARLQEHCQQPYEREKAEAHSPTRPFSEMTLPAPELLEESEDGARFFCLKPKRALTLSNLAAMTSRLLESGNINELGTPFSAEIHESADSLSLLSVEIVESFNPEKMFPLSVDCPGNNHPELPRPQGIRTLAAEHEAKPIITAYTHSTRAIRRLQEYEERLTQGGAQVLTPPTGDRQTALSRIVRTRDETFVVTAVDHDSESSLIVSRLPH